MGVLPHAALQGLTSDPRSGVVAVYKSVHLVIENNEFSDLNKSIIKKLNLNINKYYPHAGGILMGYREIKLLRSTMEVNNNMAIHPVHIRAKFFLFSPHVGSELQCTVSRKEEGLVTCMVHGLFEVKLVNPAQCQAVLIGQTVAVKVDAVEQLAWQEPRIVGSLLLEDVSDDITPCIDIVDNFEDDEIECVTDSVDNNVVSKEQIPQSSGGGDGSPHVACAREEERVEIKEDKMEEYFPLPLRRKKRKTKAELRKEEMEGIELILLANNDSNMGLEVNFIENKGRGIKAVRDFSKGDFVVEYAGDLIDIGTAKELEAKYMLDTTKGCYMYFFKHKGQQYCIDATEESGRYGRLLNHSRVNPNCMTKVVMLGDSPRLILVAKSDIAAGTELVFDYGDRRKESVKAHPWLAL